MLGGSAVDHFKHSAVDLLQVGSDLEDLSGLRISRGAEHTHEDLWRSSEVGTELDEADRSVDVLAQDRFTRIEVADDHAADGFAQEGAAKLLALLKIGSDGSVEASCKWHSASDLRACTRAKDALRLGDNEAFAKRASVFAGRNVRVAEVMSTASGSFDSGWRDARASLRSG